MILTLAGGQSSGGPLLVETLHLQVGPGSCVPLVSILASAVGRSQSLLESLRITDL